MRGGGGSTRFIPGGRRRPMANLVESNHLSVCLCIVFRSYAVQNRTAQLMSRKIIFALGQSFSVVQIKRTS